MSWFKLSISKGKFKKRAHKKLMKKTGVTDYLKKVEGIIMEELNTPEYHDKIDKAVQELTDKYLF